MLLFQIEDTAIKAVDRAFNINPESVFGFLVGLLLLLVIGLGYLLKRKEDEIKTLNLKVLSLTETAVTVITNNSNVLETLGDAIHDLKSATPTQIKNLESRIIEAIKDSQEKTKLALDAIRK